MKFLLVASAVGAIGSGKTGGVSASLENMIEALALLDHEMDVLASDESNYTGPAKLIRIAGNYQPTVVDKDSIYPIIPNALLNNYWNYVREHQGEYDAVINFCHDWLPFYITPFLHVPVLHQTNVADENPVVSEQIRKIARQFPGRVSAASHAQAASLSIADVAYVIGRGLKLNDYSFSECPIAGQLLWCARISREKGLQDAAQAAQLTGKKLVVCGFMEDENYFQEVMRDYADVIDYRGFLAQHELAKIIGQSEALLCTHTWVEAFGRVVIEALACGTPVITYNRGGPAEVVTHGTTGYVVPDGDVQGLVTAISQLGNISRHACRKQIADQFDIKVYSRRVAQWIEKSI